MLEVRSLSKNFGGVKAVKELDLAVNAGDIFGVIGPNGSGKSTLVNLISGVFSATTGDILFQGQSLSRLSPHARVRMGVARTFQNIRLFPGLTVWQNLWVARNSVEDTRAEGVSYRWFRKGGPVKTEIDDMLEFAGLADKGDELASNLAFGEQRRLELARAAATKPRLLLLDEPAAGMNQDEIRDLDWRIRQLRQQGMTIILIEHVMDLVMGVTDRIAVLNFGSKIAEGEPAAIQESKSVQEAYLGQSEGD